jgi:hypothetical protein
MCESLIKHRGTLMQAVEDPHFANLAAISTSTYEINTDGLSAEDVEELQELKADIAEDVAQMNVLEKMRDSTKCAVTHIAVQTLPSSSSCRRLCSSTSLSSMLLHRWVQTLQPFAHAWEDECAFGALLTVSTSGQEESRPYAA